MAQGFQNLSDSDSCLNVRASHILGLQRALNNLSAKIEEINQQQMTQKQQYVKRIPPFADKSSDVKFDVLSATRI